MNLLTTVLRNTILMKNGGRKLNEHLKMISVRFLSHGKMMYSCHIVCTNQSCNRYQLFGDFFRTFTNDSSSSSSSSNNNNNNNNNNTNETRAILIPKTLSRLARKRKIKEVFEERQLKIQKGVEIALQSRKDSLTNTRKKLQERGKSIIKDIKETKDKVREKIEGVIERENVYTIPNFLCAARIGLSPLLSYLIVTQRFECALAFMVVAGVSDWVDGWIARNYKSQSSKIGSFLDPMADKVLIGTLFLSLTYIHLIPLPLTVLIICRDVILIISGFVIRYKSLPPPRTLSRYFDVTYATAQLAPTFISKVNTGIQLILAATTLASPILGINQQFLHSLWYVTGASTIVAASSYIFSKETYKYLKTKEKNK